MGAAPLSWLAKIGSDTLKTKAKLLSSAINELYDDGQCKIVAVVDNTADNGKTVLITTDDNKTYSGTIANKKCEFLLPPKTLYTVQKVSSGSAEFTTKVEAGYGDCILVHLDTGYVEVKQGDIVGLDYIKAATDDDLKNKVPEAKAVKKLNSSLGGCEFSIENDGAYVTYTIGADSVKKKLGSSIQYLGEGKTFNLLSLAPDVDYTSLTTDNFIVVPVSISSSKSASHHDSVFDGSSYLGCEMIAHTFSSKKTYNSQTGVLTISSDSIQGKAYLNGTGFTHTTTASVNFGVYLVS